MYLKLLYLVLIYWEYILKIVVKLVRFIYINNGKVLVIVDIVDVNLEKYWESNFKLVVYWVIICSWFWFYNLIGCRFLE